MICAFRKLLAGAVGLKIISNTRSTISSRRSHCLHWSAKYVAKQKRILCVRSFQCGSTHQAKKYVEIENEHARSYLKKNSLYSSTLLKPIDLRMQNKCDSLNDILNQDWSCREPGEVLDAFQRASVISEQFRLDICHPKLKSLCSAVMDVCDRCEDSQIFVLLQCLSLWPPVESIKSGQYYSLWRALDQVCLSKVKTWDIDKNLLMIDHWAYLNLARSSKFVCSSLIRISQKLNRLSSQQFVQLMFYINLCRKFPLSTSKFELEYNWESLYNKQTLEELSIVAMGFFKSKSHVKSQRIIEGILSRLESCFRNGKPPPPDSIMLASLLKVLRTSLHPTQAVMLHNTLDSMLPYIKNFSILCCLHVALVGSNIQVIHEEVMHSLCERFAVEVNNCRIKDIERLAFILTLYNYDPKTNPCIYEAMVSEIRKRVAERKEDGTKWEELDKYGECFMRFLGFLTFRQIFPLDLIEHVMNPAFIQNSYGNKLESTGRELLLLDTCLEIYFPDHIKIRLIPELRTRLSKRYHKDPARYLEDGRMSAVDRLFIDVFKTIRSLSGSAEAVTLRHILPQFERPDIVFCTGRNEEFQKLSLQKYSHEALQSCPTDSGIWHAVIPCGRNSFIKLSNQPVGPLSHRLSMLKKLGYKAILVPYYDWDAKTNEEKEIYLKHKIFNSEI